MTDRSLMKPHPVDRLLGIELLRFLAAFAVLLAHYQHFYMYGYAYENYALEKQPLFSVFAFFYTYGTRAVEAFWCVSGFIFFFRYGEVIRRRLVRPVEFFWLRFSRLYPLHVLTLVLVAVLQLWYRAQHGSYFVVEINDVRHFVSNLFFASHWALRESDPSLGASFNAPVWSVSLEVLAYFFFFVVTYVAGASFFEVLLCLAGCKAVAYFTTFDAVIVRCIFYFYLGGLSCLAYQLIQRRAARARPFVAVGGLALTVWFWGRFRSTGDVLWLLNAVVPLLLLLLAIASAWLGQRSARFATTLGNLTYASYLIHFPLQLLMMLLVGWLQLSHAFASSTVFFLGYVAGTFALSHVVYRYLERPAQDYIRKRMIVDRAPDQAEAVPPVGTAG